MEFASLNTYNSHARSNKHKKAIASASVGSGTPVAVADDDGSEKEEEEEEEDVIDEPVVVSRLLHGGALAVSGDGVSESKGGAGEDAEEEDDGPTELTPMHCIFCRNVAADVTR